MNSTEKGNISEAKILAHLVSIGYVVLVPFGLNKDYDLAVDTGNHIFRIECKTGRMRNGCVQFNTSNKVYTGDRKSYKERADYFCVYCPDNEGFYILPVASVGEATASLRVDIPKSNSPRIRYAHEYELVHGTLV